jgi:hypothetical protein
MMGRSAAAYHGRKGGKNVGKHLHQGLHQSAKDAGLERKKLRETVDPEGSFIIGSRFFPSRLALHLSLPEE